MNVRLGMARVARATAVCYALAATLVVGLIANDGYGRTLPNPFERTVRAPAEGKPWETYWTPYVVNIGAHTVGFLEPDEKELQADVKRWAAAHPPYLGARDALVSGSWAALAALALYMLLWAAFRGLRWIARGFFDDRTPV
jgi:hypothetical protein